MPRVRAIQFALAGLLAALGAGLIAFNVELFEVGGAKLQSGTPPKQVKFDYYVFALSWSPGFCIEEADERNGPECGPKAHFGFVVRGLWPQKERGFPIDCDPETGRVPQSLARDLRDIMPLAGFVGHQWRAHGACSGLSMDEYFALTRRAYDRLTIPENFRAPKAARAVSAGEVRGEFIAVNPGLAGSMIRIVCSEKLFREVRVCMTKDLAFRACGDDVRDQCAPARVSVLPVP